VVGRDNQIAGDYDLAVSQALQSLDFSLPLANLAFCILLCEEVLAVIHLRRAIKDELDVVFAHTSLPHPCVCMV
jgi:hypothetical protein